MQGDTKSICEVPWPRNDERYAAIGRGQFWWGIPEKIDWIILIPATQDSREIVAKIASLWSVQSLCNWLWNIMKSRM